MCVCIYVGAFSPFKGQHIHNLGCRERERERGGVAVQCRCSHLCWCRMMMSLLAAHFLQCGASGKQIHDWERKLYVILKSSGNM